MEEDKRGERLFIPSNMENKKKRIVAKSIEGKTGKRMEDYQDEFDYLISSGIALDVKAVSQPTFPLVQNMGKNLLNHIQQELQCLQSLRFLQRAQRI